MKSGETTAPYCAAFALPGSVPFVLGEMVSVQMPHQHRILGRGGHTYTTAVFSWRAVQHFIDIQWRTHSPKYGGWRDHFHKPPCDFLLLMVDTPPHAREMKDSKRGEGSRTVNGLCFGGLFSL